MNAKKILCAVDFSPCSNVAWQHALELARGHKAKLVVANVMAPPPTYVSGYAGYGALPPYQPEPDPRLEDITVPDGSVELEHVHLVGLEGEAIVEYAEENDFDLIVLGTHGHGGLTRLFLGSVADYVLRHAKCSVIVVKDRKAERDMKKKVTSDVEPATN